MLKITYHISFLNPTFMLQLVTFSNIRKKFKIKSKNLQNWGLKIVLKSVLSNFKKKFKQLLAFGLGNTKMINWIERL